MDRKAFLKQLFGINIQAVLGLGGVLLVIYLLQVKNAVSFSADFLAIAKMLGVLVLLFLLFASIAIAIIFIARQILKVLPAALRSFLFKHGKSLLIAAWIPVLAYIVYELVQKRDYFLLIFYVLYILFSYLTRSKEKSA